MAELEPSLFQTQVEQARANLVRVQAEIERSRVQLAEAERARNRARELAERNLVSLTDLEAAEASALSAESSLRASEAQVVQAEASLNQAQVNLSHTVITAPIDGVVISRNVDVGQTVAASMSAPVLFQIANDMAQMRVSANIAESDIGVIEVGQPVTFEVDAFPAEAFFGVVIQVRLNPVIEQNVVSYVTVIQVPNPELKLRPGMSAVVSVETGREREALTVPASALRFSPTPEVFASLGQEPGAGEDLARGLGEDAETPGAPAAQAAGNQGAQRAAFAELSDEERQAFIAARGGGARGGATGRAGAGRRGDGAAAGGAGTPNQTAGQVWVIADGQVQAVPVQIGLSDGVRVAVTGGGLQEGVIVVTGAIETVAEVAPLPSGSPLVPQFGRGRGGGGRGR